MTKEDAANQLEKIFNMEILPHDDDPYKTSDALYMAINELRKKGPAYPNLHLIDKRLLISKLVEARDVIKIICNVEHPHDDFKHPLINIIDMIVAVISFQEEVKL